MKRLPRHKPWRTSRDDFILRIYGWGKMIDITRGFDVRFPIGHGFPQKYFSVSRYGGERAALAAAISRRKGWLLSELVEWVRSRPVK